MEKMTNHAGMLPIWGSTCVVGALIMFVCSWSLFITYALDEFWQCYSVFALVYLILAIGKYGWQHVVAVLLWWLAGMVPMGLLGAAMLYNLPPMTLIASVAVIGLVLFVAIYSIMLVVRKRFEGMSVMLPFFLSLNLGISVALVCRLLMWLN